MTTYFHLAETEKHPVRKARFEARRATRLRLAVMASDTITFMLEGDISLASFADAFKSFNNLIVALSTEEGASNVEWTVVDLAPGSTVATIRGQAMTPEPIERVVRAYESVGRSLQRSEPIQRSARVIRPAMSIGRMIGEKVKTVRFETAEREAVISMRPSIKRMRRRPPTPTMQWDYTPEPAEQVPGAYGAVEGQVQMLTSRHGLRFTLYDSLNDRAVSCYLQPGNEEIMRDVWGKRAIVQGWITRDAASGRPLAIRRVERVTPIVAEGDYTAARAILPLGAGDLSPEGRIRRLRDA